MAAMKVKVGVEVVDDNTINVWTIQAHIYRMPVPLHTGERHADSLRLYEDLRALAEADPGTSEFEVDQLMRIEIKPFEVGTGSGMPSQIEARRIDAGSNPSWEFVSPGRKSVCGLSFDELLSLGPGEHYVPRKW
jgi:hypothetical protein